MAPTFFATPAELRRWFARHHANERELWLGFHKKQSRTPSVTWPEAVDEALCVGWIDGVRKRIDEASYQIRFTPRRPGSTWSTVNVGRVRALTAEGRMRPAGLAAFEARSELRSGRYSYEQRGDVTLDPEYERILRSDAGAWRDFASRPPSYRKTVVWWVMNAKREETRRRRLATLVESSRQGELVPWFIRPQPKEDRPGPAPRR
jgi:uncharacterized protein YdeI (YjbR/CyaY-like superfamily)